MTVRVFHLPATTEYPPVRIPTFDFDNDPPAPGQWIIDDPDLDLEEILDTIGDTLK